MNTNLIPPAGKVAEHAANLRTEAECRATLRKPRAPITMKSPDHATWQKSEAFTQEWFRQGATGMSYKTVSGERIVRITFNDGYDADTGKFYDMGDGL